MSNLAQSILSKIEHSQDLLLGNRNNSNWIWILHISLITLLLTRIYTQFRRTHRPADASKKTRSIPCFPYWIPYLGDAALLFSFSQSKLAWLAQVHDADVFALRLAGQTRVVVTTPGLLRQLEAAPVSARAYGVKRARRVFANASVSDRTGERVAAAKVAWGGEKARMNRLGRLLETEAYNLISPATSWVDQAQWERTAECQVLETAGTLDVSADFTVLIRGFASSVLLSTMLGASFVEANPGFIGDLFSFSAKYGTFMTGLPYWIAPGLGPPAYCRERCLIALDGLVKAMLAEVDGKSMRGMGTGMLYELDDVQGAIWDAVKEARKEHGDERIRAIAAEVLEIVWELLFPSVNLILWLVIRLFAADNRIVLETIKDELKKVVEVVKPPPSGLPFDDPPRLRFKNHQGLATVAPTLQAALVEAIRLETALEDNFIAQTDFIIEDKAQAGPDESKGEEVAARYQIQKGDHVYAAYGATNKDTQYWDRPSRFAPNRWLYDDGKGKRQVHSVDTALSRPARELAAKEDVLIVLAALISFYEFGAVDGPLGVPYPGSRVVGGLKVPKDGLRAKISRRQL